MNPFKHYNRTLWTPARLRSLYGGLSLLALALIAQIVIGPYVARWSSGAAYSHDLILDNIPVVNLDFFIVGGSMLTQVVAWWLLIVRPKYLNFGLKAVALFVFSRVFFMSLTHMGSYPFEFAPSAANYGWSIYSHITFQGNFFYSGHTGFPFLMALIFWDNAFWRRIFLVLSAAFGAAVLLAHVHYSIDVFASPFIVYGMYRIAEKWWPEDRELIDKKLEEELAG